MHFRNIVLSLIYDRLHLIDIHYRLQKRNKVPANISIPEVTILILTLLRTRNIRSRYISSGSAKRALELINSLKSAADLEHRKSELQDVIGDQNVTGEQ